MDAVDEEKNVVGGDEDDVWLEVVQDEAGWEGDGDRVGAVWDEWRRLGIFLFCPGCPDLRRVRMRHE